MQYTSTRDSSLSVSSSFAIAHGISAEGGLFVPKEIPQIDRAWLKELCDKEYPARATGALPFLTDFTSGELAEAAAAAYTDGVFEEGLGRPPFRPFGWTLCS